MSTYNTVTDRVIISPEGKGVSICEMEHIFEEAGTVNETIFRRLEFNQIIQFAKGISTNIGCGLNKIHSAAIGITEKLTRFDTHYDGRAMCFLPDTSTCYPFETWWYLTPELVMEFTKILGFERCQLSYYTQLYKGDEF